MKPWSCLALAACLPDLSDTLDPGPLRPDPPPVVQTTPATGDSGLGLVVATIAVDATSYDDWVGLDLDAFDPGSPLDGAAWDLRFRRFEVALNGGVSGDGDVAAAHVDDTFDALEAAPPDVTFVEDRADADGDGVPEYALLDWYRYDEATHALSPAPGTWLVRSTEGQLFRLVFTSYYDPTGTPAQLSLRTGPIPPET